jgi:hypothetical protein
MIHASNISRSPSIPGRLQWRDYRDGNKQKTISLEAGEFIRGVLLDILPGGLQRIRHFGFLTNRVRQDNIN